MSIQRFGRHATWRKSAVAVAVGMALLSGTAVYAQSNTAGVITGQVGAASGQTVVIENLGSGVSRTLTPDSQGRFRAAALPTGMYKVTLMRDGKPVSVNENVEVQVGQSSEVRFADAATQKVEVSGSVARLDVATASNGVTFTSKMLDSLPIAGNVGGIIQLAPNTTRADPRYSGGASFGGGAPSENSYYINGFPVTNPLTQLGSSELPFGAIGQAQVLTGGFGAEFGRSIGGVVNIITKRGTNDWHGGVQMSWAPKSLRSEYNDIKYPNTGAPENAGTDGKLYRRQSDSTLDEKTVGGYIGGPLIKDKLFMFGAVEYQDNQRNVAVASDADPAGGFAERANTVKRYLGKFDWYLTSDHLLELTLIGDTYKQDETVKAYDFATGAIGDTILKSSYRDHSDKPTDGVGADSQILKYTGFLTPDLTLSALFGQSKTKHENSFDRDVFNLRQVSAPTSARYPGLTYNSPWPLPPASSFYEPGSEDTVKAARIDLEFRLGNHLLRGGIDDVKLKSKTAGINYIGGGQYNYYRTTNPNNKGASYMTTTVSAAGALQSGGYYYYGREQIFRDVTDAASNQSALYLEDQWQVNKRLVVTPGLRFERYENVNGEGETFLKPKDQLHPRLSFAWDVNGDASLKVFGSAGRYGVQIPTHLAVRGASRSLFTRQYFVYSGIDANGAPTGRVNLGDPYSTNNEYNQAKDPKTVAAQDLRPNSQDEITLGFEKAMSPLLNVGARLTYRRMVATIDDTCDDRPFYKYADDHGIDTSNYLFNCASFNPGMSNTFLVNYAGTGELTRIKLSKEDMGFPEAKRSYFAVDLFAEHPLKNGWYGRVNYTYSKSKGNTEGQTLSDIAQTDVAATQSWDLPELSEGAYGYLPNDRRHQIKAYGFYRVMPQLDIGANLLLASGRPKNCIGNYRGTSLPADDPYYNAYGNSYFWCTSNGQAVATPRGSQGNLPWDTRLDMNLTYRPPSVKGLTLRMDVFNLFNKQTIQAIDEVHEPAYDETTTSATYGRVISYTAPRYFRFTASYDF